MALKLTATERDLVDSKRKQDRSSWYNSATGSWQEISKDFEAFLILTDSTKKSSAVSWINVATQELDADSTRDDLAEDFLQREAYDLVVQVSQLELLTEPYSLFRSSFIEDSRFLAISEVGTLLEDTKLGADKTFTQLADLKHQAVMNDANDDRLGNGQDLSENRVTQVQSWSVSLLTPYL